jgi:tRNA(fMet)-specific endonuclease VapC
MKLALDTNAYSGFLRGEARCVDVVRRATQIHLPVIVLGELRAGFAAGGRETENLADLGRFLASPRVSVVAADERTAEVYARVYLQLRRRGMPIPTNDLWIAAVCIQHGLALCTADAHFAHVEALIVV